MSTKKLLCLFIFLSLIIPACAAYRVYPPTVPTLKKRVRLLWEARAKNDWASVYDMTDQKFRHKVSRRQFVKVANLSVKAFRILDVALLPGGKKASSLVIFKTYKLGHLFEISIREDWILEDGVWYLNLSDQKTPFDKRTKG